MCSIFFIVSSQLLAGLALGAILQRSDFCMAGAFRDIFLFGDYLKARAIFLAVSLLVLIVYLERVGGLIGSYPPSFFASPSGADLLGGALFGMGMVLGGGCMLGTLYKMGSGKVLNLFTFAGMIAGGIFYPVFLPLKLKLVSATGFFPRWTALEQIAGMHATAAGFLLISALFIARWAGKGLLSQKGYAEGYLQLWKAALAIVLVVSAQYVFSGRPLSVTSGIFKMSALMAHAATPAAFASVQPFTGNSVRLVYGRIMPERLMNAFDAVGITQFPLIAGIVGGSFLSALQLREFKPLGVPPFGQIISSISGGALMSVGALMASGCNLWHFFGGLPVFALQSILFLFGIIPGSYAGSLIIKKAVCR